MKLAIDWGTSYTKIGYLKEGTLINLAGPYASVPTAAAYNDAVGLIFGSKALRLRENTLTVPQFKLELKRNPNFFLGPVNMESLLYEYFNFLLQNYIIPAGEPLESVTVGVPNYFGLNARRLLLDVLIRCFRVEKVELLPEPAAAAIGYNLNNEAPLQGEILSIDIGGGTSDFSFISIAGRDDYTVESQFQTGHDAFSGNEIDRAIVNNILWPEFVISTGFNRSRFPFSDMSPRQTFLYNRMLQAAQNLKLELGKQEEVYLNLPDFYESQSLQLVINRTAFLAQLRTVFDNLAAFIETSVKSRARHLGLLNNNKWDIDNVLLVGGASHTLGVCELLARSFSRVPLTLPCEREFNVLKGLCVWADRSSISSSVKTVYPFSFYIERFDSDSQSSVLEKIPFDFQNLRLDIKKRYRILTLNRDTPFNLSPDPEYFNLRIYEGDAETANLSDRFSGRDLVMEISAPRSSLPDQIAICLDLSRAKLELEGGNPNILINDDAGVFNRLRNTQIAWYNCLNQAKPNPGLMADYLGYLENLQGNQTRPFSGHDKSTLFKLYALIDIMQKKKERK
ncbi:MAG TPA: Hsp70 family protein [Syntrophomonadaceae bacterium]|nr:Hsp70 family protein [Syntrophomonadaceae bacterium]